MEVNKKHIKETKIDGLFVVSSETFSDDRGFFRELYHQDELESTIGRKFRPVQWNHSMSRPKVIRGIHPDPWDKLVYPLTGDAFIAIVDINPLSATFKNYETFTINNSYRPLLFITKGLGNSLCVTGSENMHYMYLVTSYWDGHKASGMRAIAYNDPDLSIPWPVKDPVISEKDRQNATLRELYYQQYPHLFNE